MAAPARKYEPDPGLNQDPVNPVPPGLTDPVGPGPAVNDAGSRPIVENQQISRGSGGGVLIAAIIVILAAVAFYMFGPGMAGKAPEGTTAPPAATTESAPANTAPDTGTTTEPNAMAPSAPAEQSVAPKAEAPAEQAPAAQPAPAPAQ